MGAVTVTWSGGVCLHYYYYYYCCYDYCHYYCYC